MGNVIIVHGTGKTEKEGLIDMHKPLMSEEEAEKRREWQEKVYQRQKKINRKQKFKVLGKEWVVLPGLFAPIWPDSTLLAKSVRKEVKQDDSVLDLGTGTGIQGIFAAEKASKVMAVDINLVALKCAKINVKNLGLENKMKVFKSDLFSNVKGKFDLIIFNPPFRWFKPRDMMERGNLDENYETLRAFFSKVGNYLKEGGRILLIFATSGDIKYLKQLIRSSEFNSKILAKQKSGEWEYTVYRLSVA